MSLPLTVVSVSAHADWIMLSNGDRMSGNIVEQTTATVTMDHSVMGRVSIPQSKIASVHTGRAPRVLARELRTGQPISGIPTAPVAQPVASAPEVPAVASIEPAAGDKPEHVAGVYKWTGRVSAGGNIQDGNTRSKDFIADADIKARDLKNRYTMGGEANWAESAGNKTENDQQLYGTYDRFITEKWFVGGQQTFEKDEFEQLDLRSKTGLFVGHQFYEQDNLNLQVKAGPSYISESFENGTSDDNIALGWALDYDQKIIDEAVQIFHKHDLNTPFDDTAAFLFESETGVHMPIGKRLDATAQVDFDWDNDPLAGTKEDDTTYALKLGYGW